MKKIETQQHRFEQMSTLPQDRDFETENTTAESDYRKIIEKFDNIETIILDNCSKKPSFTLSHKFEYQFEQVEDPEYERLVTEMQHLDHQTFQLKRRFPTLNAADKVLAKQQQRELGEKIDDLNTQTQHILNNPPKNENGELADPGKIWIYNKVNKRNNKSKKNSKIVGTDTVIDDYSDINNWVIDLRNDVNLSYNKILNELKAIYNLIRRGFKNFGHLSANQIFKINNKITILRKKLYVFRDEYYRDSVYELIDSLTGVGSKTLTKDLRQELKDEYIADGVEPLLIMTTVNDEISKIEEFLNSNQIIQTTRKIK